MLVLNYAIKNLYNDLIFVITFALIIFFIVIGTAQTINAEKIFRLMCETRT